MRAGRSRPLIPGPGSLRALVLGIAALAGLATGLPGLPSPARAQDITLAAHPGVVPGGRAGDWEPLEPDAWPWTAIGRVNVVADLGRKGLCTGTLVAPTIVLTAAHCLVHPVSGAPVTARQVFFQVGYARGRDLGNAGVARIVRSPAFTWASKPDPAMASDDWAFLVLTDPLEPQPLPVAAVPYAEVARLSASGALSHVGYGRERQHLPSLVRRCRASGDPTPRLLRHSCLSNYGYSGAPLIAMQDRGPVVIGVASIADLGRSGIASPAERFAATLEWLRR